MMKKLRKRFFILCLFIALSFAVFLLLDSHYPMPNPLELKKFSQLVVDKNGRPLRAFADNQGVWRYPTQIANVSKNYIEALINYEDRYFWQHRGVNPFSLLRAVKQMVVNGRVVSGGSTLTMQVARILNPHSKSIGGKLWQIFRAFQLEYHLEKEDILNLYLNYAPFGGPIEGIEAATYTYLGKSAKNLTDAQAALMVVLPQAPSRFRPDRHPKRAQKARDKVLRRLATHSVWSNKKVARAQKESVYAQFNSRPLIAPLLARRLAQQFPDKPIINSNIDMNMQLHIAAQVKAYLGRFSESTSASALLVDNKSLNVLAYVGAGDFANKKRFGHIDMNRAIRSPGSTLKPFIYAMAMDKQLIHSQSLLQDVPLHFGQYSPKNFTRNFSGPVSVTQALQRSLNIPAVQVLSHLGAENFAGQIENAGLHLYFTDKSKPSLSLALGGVGVKLEGLVSVYRSLAAGGLAGKLRYTQDAVKQESYLISKESAWIVGDILSKVPLLSRRPSMINRGLTKRSNQWLAHKTGTSYGHRDAWLVAVTTQYTLAVWIGKPDGTPSPGEFGRKTAAPLARTILNSLENKQIEQLKRPQKVQLQTICWPLGKLKTAQNADACLQEKAAWLIDNVAPFTLHESDKWEVSPINIQIDPQSQQRVYASCFDGKTQQKKIAIWPARLELWLADKWRFKNLMPPLHPQCQNQIDVNQQLVIIGLQDGSRIAQPPNAKTGFSISLSVSAGKGKVLWLNNGKLVGESQIGENFSLTQLQKGRQKLVVFDENGNSGQLEFEFL